MEREKGVISAPCYSCGAALPTVEQPDGGCAAVPCPGCTKAAPQPVDLPKVEDPEDDDKEED
ncbi:hypothetical protein GCM10028801_30960 [Nocardioides maradonensis]